MTDASATRSPESAGFTSRWMLDSSDRARAASVPGDANATARPIDTDGDGVADTLAVRVDAERETLAGRIAGWIGRSLVTLLLVAALVVAAAAAAAYAQAREELDRATTQLAQERADAAAARARADRLGARVTELEGAALEAERDELALEVQVLRGMLLDDERQRTDAR